MNDNMMVIVMIETPIGVAHAFEIANVPGVDGVLGANTDLGKFSGWFDHKSALYQNMVKRLQRLSSGAFARERSS